MLECNIWTLTIDDAFKSLILPLSPGERNRLEESLLRDGCREPLCVWNRTILDGHHRYEICTRHHIAFKIAPVFLKSREEAIAWICVSQLGRSNITGEFRRYLIGKRYKTEQIIGAHHAAGMPTGIRREGFHNMLTEPIFGETFFQTRERIGKAYRISHATVHKYAAYTTAIDVIARAEPELTPKILSGQIKMSQENVLSLSRLPAPDIRRIIADLAEDDAAYSDTRTLVPKRQKKKPDYPPLPEISIKNMPEYDPDAEILGLVFTIPSWIGSIDRTHSAANFAAISGEARDRLENELRRLRSMVDTMLLTIKKENK